MPPVLKSTFKFRILTPSLHTPVHHGDDTHLDLWLICWHLHQVGPDKKATPAGVTQLAKCKHGYSRPGEPQHRWHRTPLGPPFWHSYVPTRWGPLTGNNTAPAATAPAKRKSLHLDSLKSFLLARITQKHLPRTSSHYVWFSQIYWHFSANFVMHICSMLQVCIIVIWSLGLILNSRWSFSKFVLFFRYSNYPV